MQNIFTSYYGNRRLDRRSQLLVRVSNSAPTGVAADAVPTGAVPDWGMIVAPYKEGNLDEETYGRLYRAQLEGRAQDILRGLAALREEAAGRDIVLLCYEKPGRFCHRRLLAAWLEEKGAADEVEELGTGQLTLF